ncbi:hypothetical protein MBLNU459_g6594t1 [Dothideomycetes sp. NU459]
MPPRAPPGAASKNGTAPAPAKGVLPVGPLVLGQHHNVSTKSNIRLKLEVRRLPPGLTQDEFLGAFGDEWRPMKGKVDWLQYRSGKTKGPGKPSEQARAYVKLGSEAHLRPYETKFLSISFQDARGTHKDPALKHLQPALAFAPNQRVPAAKQRLDGRQGTIDQDPEFIAFLEAETQPVARSSSLAAPADKPKDKVTSTPLLDDLREKKANKAKAASAKPSKPARADAKEDKAAAEKPSRAAKADAAKGPAKPDPAKDVAKTPGKQSAKAAASRSSPASAAAGAGPSGGAAAAAATAAQQPGTASPAPTRKRGDRVTPNAIKSMLQRDLGIAPPNGKRGGKSAASDTASTASQPASPAVSSAPATTDAPATKPAKPSRAARRGGPLAEKGNGQPANTDAAKASPAAPSGILKKPATAQATPKGSKGKAKDGANTPANAPAASSPTQSSAPSKPAKAAAQPSAGATKAYLKHTNASQGITEPLIQAALAVFGQVVKVDIDKRKGTAIAEFRDHEGLKAAMAKRSVPVAQGAVEVLEYRDKPAASGPARGGAAAAAAARGGSMRGRGRGARGSATSAAAATAAPAPPSASSPAPAAATPAGGDAT